MAFKFVVLACALAVANSSYIHTPMGHGYGASTAQYGTQEVHYPSGGGGSSQGVTSQTESILRGHENLQGQLSATQEKAVQITSGQYANQGKSDVRVTNPGSYSTGNYNNAQGSQEQQVVTYTPTPGYNNHPGNRYEHSASSSYQQSTPVYGHSTTAYVQPTPVYGQSTGAVYSHNSLPVYHYATSGYAGQGGSGYSHGAAPTYSHPASNRYSQAGNSAGGPGLLGVSYSPAVSVSHMSYTSPVGVSYAW
ncbi:uncharacterized protein LOC124409857 [Diprion similis]|uniref:uncharacterized protein LOC124409857 n=1 Tax=Diprion similis TaxID=362088 RepID=UPI001EF8BDCD|nr:uncharacterized protein LOC124409857 [Diprion similis]